MERQDDRFTGTFETMSRDEAKARPALARGRGSVIARTDLVVAARAGIELKKAEELGVRVIGEADWAKLVAAALAS